MPKPTDYRAHAYEMAGEGNAVLVDAVAKSHHFNESLHMHTLGDEAAQYGACSYCWLRAGRAVAAVAKSRLGELQASEEYLRSEVHRLLHENAELRSRLQMKTAVAMANRSITAGIATLDDTTDAEATASASAPAASDSPPTSVAGTAGEVVPVSLPCTPTSPAPALPDRAGGDVPADRGSNFAGREEDLRDTFGGETDYYDADGQLLAAVGDAFAERDPVPPHVLDDARDAYATHTDTTTSTPGGDA